MKTFYSDKLFDIARQLMPGGVNSPVRAFKSVGRNPLFIKRAFGSHIWDVDRNEFIDYIGSWGPMILGHSHPKVIEAIKMAVELGTSYGAPTEIEVKLAELITRLMPSIEMIRMVNSGTEATMSAIRLARAYTKRDKIIKFEGCYHGHGDSFLIRAGSGATTLGVPDSPGVTQGTAKDTLNARYNDIDSVKELIADFKEDIAAIIVEPVAGNMGCVPPKPGFLEGLCELCTQEGIVLIFDEVITGFRVSPGGAQKLYDVKPDLTTLGKIIGGGLPVGAYGGRREIMEMVAPSGPVYQAGTLSGNPLAMAAGYETLKIISEDKDFYKRLEEKSKCLTDGIQDNIKRLGLPLTQNRVGSMFTLFFTGKEVFNYETAKTSDTKRFAEYFQGMLERGIYLASSQFEAAFVSIAHTDEDLEKTVKANYEVLEKMFKSLGR